MMNPEEVRKEILNQVVSITSNGHILMDRLSNPNEETRKLIGFSKLRWDIEKVFDIMQKWEQLTRQE